MGGCRERVFVGRYLQDATLNLGLLVELSGNIQYNRRMLFTAKEITETIDMFMRYKLDVRCITMGISLLDCADSSGERARSRIYDKIMGKAQHLVEVGKQIEAFYYKDAAGQKVKLVSNVEVYNRSVGRPPVLSAPPPAGLAELLCSIILSVLVFIFTFWRYKRPPAGNRALGILQSVLGLFLGGVGTVLFFMTIFTNHDYTWNNLNAFYVNPLLLAAVPLGLVLAFSKKRAQGAQRALNVLWAYVLLAGLVVQLLNLVPALRQVDQPTALLVLPLSLALIISAFCARIPQYGMHPKSRH
jgi:hypothetical protein